MMKDDKGNLEDFKWLHEQLNQHIMHEDILLEQRTSFFITATSVLVGAYSLSFVASQNLQFQVLIFRISLSVFGVLFCIFWEGVTTRTQSANEMWKEKIRKLELELESTGKHEPGYFSHYLEHVNRFGKDRTKKIKFIQIGISTQKTWKIIPFFFLALWIVFLILSVLILL